MRCLIWSGLVWSGVRRGTVWYGTVWYGMDGMRLGWFRAASWVGLRCTCKWDVVSQVASSKQRAGKQADKQAEQWG